MPSMASMKELKIPSIIRSQTKKRAIPKILPKAIPFTHQTIFESDDENIRRIPQRRHTPVKKLPLAPVDYSSPYSEELVRRFKNYSPDIEVMD